MHKNFDWDRYFKHAEITEYLQSIERDYPDLAKMYSIGKTLQNRDIWCMEVTNTKTGPAAEKPASYVDGNIHAGEVTGSMVALYAIKYLVSNYGKDPRITKVLDDTAFYIVPRLSADGSELYLNEADTLRSVPRPWPHEEQQDGLYPFDIDGDGIIAQIRIEDEDGQWRVSEKDPRVMVRRKPNEIGGKYYTIMDEGKIHNFNGHEIKQAPALFGLDVNRNYAANWAPHHIQNGAGPYPFSERESHAVAEFVGSRPNICIGHSNHTTGGVILRPPASKPDKEFNEKDLKALKDLGAIGTEVTGYECVGIHDDFASCWGCTVEWLYEHNGILAYATELWNLANRAFDRPDGYLAMRNPSEEEELLLQKWNDENLDGEGFINWRPFDHPQLGKVEIGGWKKKFVVQNAPTKFLKEECHKNAMFIIELGLTLPKVKIVETNVKAMSKGVYTVEAVVRNSGFLPTNVTEQGLVNKKAGEVKASVELGEGCEVVGCDEEVVLPHMSGRFTMGRPFAGIEQAKHLCKWAVTGPEGSKVKIKVQAPKAGVDVVEVELK